MVRKRKRLFILILAILVLTISLFVIIDSIYQNHDRKILNRYHQVIIGMHESEVIGLLGSPRMKARIRTSEMGDEMLNWNITSEMIEEITKKHNWLLKYSYWIPSARFSWRNIDLHSRFGLDVYINEDDNNVVLFLTTYNPSLNGPTRRRTTRTGVSSMSGQACSNPRSNCPASSGTSSQDMSCPVPEVYWLDGILTATRV